jgi:FkbM family methyltransferase
MSDRQVAKIRVRLRTWRWNLARRLKTTVTVPTRHGLLSLDTSDRYIARTLYRKREYELGLMLQTVAHLRAIGMVPAKGAGTFLDVGANLGVTCLGMLTHGEFERAIAIEPAPRNFDLLRRNVHQNGFDARVICVQVAVSDRPGTLSFELSDTNLGDHRVRVGAGADPHPDRYRESQRSVISVRSETIDATLASLPVEYTDDLALVWMDVQGFEGFAIRGGGRLFGAGRPTVIEVWPYGLRRTGMAMGEFVDLVRAHWSRFWMLRGPKRNRHFVPYPVSVFETVFDELGFDGEYENVILTR